ncbi:DUF932 domain-containing protein [Thermodesulfobacteriota bacterium]
MDNITTLAKVSDRVNEMSINCFDKNMPVKDISFDNLETVRIGNTQTHQLREIAQRSISWRLGIPYQYLKKCSPDVQKLNMNYWIEKERNEQLFFRYDGDDVRAIFTPKYKPVDNFEVIERLDSLGYGSDTRVQCSLDHEFMLLSIMDGNKAFKINGDTFKPGVSISNSEVGLASLSIAAFVMRLICSNGLIRKTEIGASYRHVSHKILSEFPEVLDNVSYELGKQKSQFLLSMESPVDNPQGTINSFNRQFQLDKVEKDAVEWAWPQEIGDTMFNIVNTYTRAAQFPGLSAGSSYQLQKVGGNILGMLN